MDFLAIDTFHSVLCVQCEGVTPAEGVRGGVCEASGERGLGALLSLPMLQALGSCDQPLDLSSLRLGPHLIHRAEIVSTSSKLCNSVRSLCELTARS